MNSGEGASAGDTGSHATASTTRKYHFNILQYSRSGESPDTYDHTMFLECSHQNTRFYQNNTVVGDFEGRRPRESLEGGRDEERERGIVERKHAIGWERSPRRRVSELVGR